MKMYSEKTEIKDIFESVLDDITSDDLKKNSAKELVKIDNDEWFDRDEDWSVYIEFQTTCDDILIDNGFILKKLWRDTMDLCNNLTFLDGMFTLIFEFEWENASWANEKYTIESVENTSEEKFIERLFPFIQKMKEFVDTDATVFLGVEIKFEDSSKIRFRKFCRELEMLYRLFIFSYRNDKLIKSNWIEFIANRMNNESSDHFGKTDNGNMFTSRQMQSIYKRIFKRDADESVADKYNELGKFGEMYRSLQYLMNYPDLNGFTIEEVSTFFNMGYEFFLFIKLGVVTRDKMTTEDVYNFWKRYIKNTFSENDIKALLDMAKSCNGYYHEKPTVRTLFMVPDSVLENSDKFKFNEDSRILKNAYQRFLDAEVYFEVRFVKFNEYDKLEYYEDNSEQIGRSKQQIEEISKKFKENHEKYFKRNAY